MPDWSYHTIFKPLLARFPSSFSREFIHRGMNRIASFPGGSHLINFLGRMESSALLEKKVQGNTYTNPVGLSGKIDPLLTGTNAFSNLGFGFIEIGPVTKHPTNGSSPVIDHEKQRIDFPSNFESIGLNKTLQKLKKWKSNQVRMVRLAGSINEQVEMMTDLKRYVDAFIIQSSQVQPIPNITNKPVYLAVPADNVVGLSLDKIQAHVSGIVLDEVNNESHESNLTRLIDATHFLKTNNFNQPIVTTGGIQEPADALTLLDAGANLIMLAGGYVCTGPGLPKRINEAALSKLHPRDTTIKAWTWYWLFGFSILIGGVFAFIFSLTSIILPYDEHFLGMEKEAILLFNERILLFMAHDRMTLAGTMISGGIVYMALARYGVRKGLLWAKQAIDFAAIVGFLGIFLFIGYGYFDWLHLIFWLILLPIYSIGFMRTRHITGTPTSPNTTNHVIWKRSLVGQLAFVSLGFAFVLGGFIISYIGITEVFVSTDIVYLCMPPEMLDAFNNKLVSVIAHDRAGFGSALVSVGFLVLMVSLWGFQQGNKWIWWMLLIGGIPAFAAGLSIHFAIEYTTFIHLLPAYIALSLWIIGLFTTYRFFHMRGE